MVIEQKIGYDRIRAQVGGYCVTEGGRRKLGTENFSRSPNVISRRQRLADQMRRALAEDNFHADYLDIDHLVRKIEIEGSHLTVEEVVALGRALTTLHNALAFLSARNEEAFPDLHTLARKVSPHHEASARIDAIIDRFGNVRDSASPELHSIRKSIREHEGKAAKKLQQVLAAAKQSGVVDAEATLSIRDGRAVIPIAAANKRKLPGFIHDESASGRTFYIEPVEVVELNNQLRELEYAERREIVRILLDFTDSLRPSAPALSAADDLLTTLDLLHAKARWAGDNRCVMPIISREGTLELRQARHPLLEQALAREDRPIVPLDIELTRKNHILVISGPNAGGKSVCLKTVGLLQWMFQCGMPVPALENSQMPIFDDLFIDIGDEQSIDNDLSTYSSHLLNMKRMLREASRDSLILIDEFGTGTEPVMGGAIAEAILRRLAERGCYGVVTTHYSNLKYFASNTSGVVNGAMMFDVANIQPLFRLEMGVPGSSFAIEIARKIGLPEDIIRTASELAGSDHVNLERQLREIARDRRYWEQKRDRIRLADKRIEEKEARLDTSLAGVKEQRNEMIRAAKAEAARITADANRMVESTIKTIRESQADKELTRLARHELDDFRVSLDDKPVPPKPVVVEKPAILQAGSKVRIKGQDTVGEVQSLRAGKATVAFGQMVTTVPSERLEVVSNAEYRKQTRTPSMKLSADISARKLNFRSTIDVRGQRVDEALETVRDFIDSALMLGVGEVTILHGKGTGALKEEIRRYLRAIPAVESAKDEHPDRGGAGITVVKF